MFIELTQIRAGKESKVLLNKNHIVQISQKRSLEGKPTKKCVLNVVGIDGKSLEILVSEEYEQIKSLVSA